MLIGGASPAAIGLVAGLYPAVWGVGQTATGHWSDRIGRKPLIVAGMLVQSAALALLAASSGDVAIAAVAAVLLGAVVAELTATSVAWVAIDMPARGRPPRAIDSGTPLKTTV